MCALKQSEKAKIPEKRSTDVKLKFRYQTEMNVKILFDKYVKEPVGELRNQSQLFSTLMIYCA